MAAAIGTARRRPQLHFTPQAGWTNDPHGILYVDGTYHLFFQYNPAGTVWSHACHWGHATSTDLVHWREGPVALTPEGDEIGCWSGAAVMDAGTPTLVYTRIVGENWNAGQVALARGDASLSQWRREPVTSVVPGAPEELAASAFRDPYLWREGDTWKMIVGTGTADGGAVVQFQSPDLLTWQYDGVLVQRPSAERAAVSMGKVWECPQLFQLDGTWVLMFSIWEDDALDHVAYALGDYDGRRFHARHWGRFSYGEQLYATTTFLDAQGDRCAMSWLRERSNTAPQGSAYAGAISLPHLLHVADDRLVASLHPDVEALRVPLRDVAVSAASGPVSLDVVQDPVLVELTGAQLGRRGGSIRWSSTAGLLVEVVVDAEQGCLRVTDGAGVQLLRAPMDRPDLADQLRLVVDADILEVDTAAITGVAAVRVPDLSAADLSVSTAAAESLRVTVAGLNATTV